MRCLEWFVTTVVTLVFLASKAFFIAKTRAGAVLMLANVFYETLQKKARISRAVVDSCLLPLLAASWWVMAGTGGAATFLLLAAASLFYASHRDATLRSGRGLTTQDPRYPKVPLPLPRLVVHIRGPILRRGTIYDCGDWPLGHQGRFELIVLNPSRVRPQFPIQVEVHVSGRGILVDGLLSGEHRCPEPGEVLRLPFVVRAAEEESGLLTIRLRLGGLLEVRRLSIRSVIASKKAVPVAAEVRRWKYGASAAFCWRGDLDLYDPATFQSEEGLRYSLALSRRFRIPSTLFVSGRLSLVQEEHRAFCEHFGWDRHPEEIPAFVRFLREEVRHDPDLEFPFHSDRPFACEFGNHMYLHLGTHAAADPGNGWKQFCWIGAGRYPWHKGPEGDSFTEQRDNALKNAEVLRQVLGVHPISWGVPGRVFDENTAPAIEAAQVEVASDSDASAWTNVLRLPPPHHPVGCASLVELTKKYPGDPDNAYKLAMLKYWLHLARRTGRAFIFMAHHHLLRYWDDSCYNITQEFFRHVLSDCHGDFYVATIGAVGRYWRDVLSERTRKIVVRCENGAVKVENRGVRPLSGIPVEVTLEPGGRFMILVDIGPGEIFEWRPQANPDP